MKWIKLLEIVIVVVFVLPITGMIHLIDNSMMPVWFPILGIIIYSIALAIILPMVFGFMNRQFK